MKILTREEIQRMGRKGGTTVIGGGGSSGGGGGGSTGYADEAGHALEADHATTADSATEATHAATADSATEAGHAITADSATNADHAITAANLDSNSTDWAKIARKDIAQTIAEVWTFAKGIVSTLKSYFHAGIEVTGGVSTDTMTASGNAQAAAMIANIFKTIGFTQAVNMIGKGFGVTVDTNGNATLQTDHLLVLGRMIVNSLNIREVSYIGGTYLLTPAACQAIKVQPLYTTISYQPDTRYWTPNGSGDVVGYRLLWLADNGSVGTMNYWKQGDIALCQTFNVTQAGAYTTAANQYYKRVVCRVGQVTLAEGGISKKYHYCDLSNIAGPLLFDAEDNPIYTVDGSQTFNGLMVGSTTPKDGDTVVQCGSESDTSRQGCIYITAEGEASIGIYDGIKDFRALSNYEIHYMSKSAVRMNAAYFSWRTNGNLRSQADVLDDIDETMTEMADISVNLKGINMTVGKMSITKHNGITANYDFWEQSGEHTIRNSSWESGYWTNQGNASPSSYRIRSSQVIYGFGQADGFLIYDMNGGQSMQFFEFNNNGTGQPPTYALRYTPPTQFAVPDTYSVKAHILSYISDGQGGWTFDLHAEEADANSGVVFITPSKGSAVRFRIYFVATGKMIGSDPVAAITNLQPYLAQAKVSNSLIQMVSDQLKVMVNQCGLNIKNRVIELIANKVNFLMPDGSTNPLISIDPASGALNAVDGNFSGTVRASNLFLNVALSAGVADTILIGANGTSEKWIGFYEDVTVDDVEFLAGEYYRVSDIDPTIFAELEASYDDCWSYCTGYASEVNFVNTSGTVNNPSVRLPRAQDVDGKVITVRHCRNSYTTSAYIEQIDYLNGGGTYHPFNESITVYDGELHLGTNPVPRLTIEKNWVYQLRSIGSSWIVIAKYKTVD